MVIEPIIESDPEMEPDDPGELESLLTQIEHSKTHIKYKCVKNCFMISIIFFCIYTSINSLSGLASSLNHETVVAMSVFAFTSVIGAYLSPVIVPIFGGRALLLVFIGTSLLYIAMELYPRYYTLIPTSVLAGISNGVAWTVQMMYCTNAAVKYASITKKPVETILEYFYGIFFVFFALTQVTGNLISSTILGISSNTTAPELNNSALCGIAFCPEFADNKTVLKRPDQASVSILIIIYMCIGAVGFILTIFGLDNLSVFIDEQAYRHRSLKSKLLSPIKVFLHPNMLLLALLYLYIGIEQNVIGSDYNEAYITCRLGVSFVGYSMMCYGACNAVGSLVSGLLGPIMGRFTVMSSILLIFLASHLFILLWDVQMGGTGVYFIAPCVFGFADGALRTQTNALVGLLFSQEQEAAYGVFNTLNVLGFGVVFAYNTAFCMDVKLYISITLLSLSYFLYVVFHCKTGRFLGKS